MKLRQWITPLVFFSNNPISLIGVVLVTVATVTWLMFLPITLRGGVMHPYYGIVVYLLLPGVFIVGLLLMPLGIYVKRRKRGMAEAYPAGLPPLDLTNLDLRRLLSFIVVTTVLNIVIAGQFFYSAINYMDTVSFCGQTCHTVMQPEFTAYQGSPHARVECVSCHIGAGASWFVRSKITGVGQVFAVALQNYPRPIPVPVRNLRPARETCETCHWPQRFGGDLLRDIPTYASDEANTLTHTVLMMHIGGGQNRIGIHGQHVGAGIRIRYYASDEHRQTIPWVEYSSAGKTSVYAVSGTARPDDSKLRVMDCMDCHNRPTHIFQLPERALDQDLYAGQISATLPFIKKEGLELLKKEYPTREDAAKAIPADLENYYKTNYPQLGASRQHDIEQAGQRLVAIYKRNIFPEMKITWGTYVNNIGHTDFPGCFRCHDELHAASDNKTITQDCSACHNVVAADEKQPKILTDLGIQAPAQ